MHANCSELIKSTYQNNKCMKLDVVTIAVNNINCKDIFAKQLPNGVLFINQSGNTTFVPDIKLVESPDGVMYFDKLNSTEQFKRFTP